MRLVRVRIKNFRCYRVETAFDIDDLTVFVGRNDVGKSTLFDALYIFFGDGKIDADDASLGGDKKDVRIICEFDDLPDQIVIDENYPTNLEQEHLLNQQGRLEIHKIYNCELNVIKPTVYAHAVHPTAEKANDLLLLKINDLKKRAQEMNAQANKTVNTLLRRAIWATKGDLLLREQDIQLDKETAKEIWTKIQEYLPTFALFKSDRPSTDQDAEAQNPMQAAVKEAIKKQEAQLNQIARQVQESVREIAEKTVEKLREMDPSLAGQLKPRFKEPNWASVFKISLTGDEDVPINKRGSGVRRLILLNFFRAKAEQAALEAGAPGIIYAIEEPETSQHPRNQRMLMRAFCDLVAHANCQILISTHTPQLARLVSADCLRHITVCGDDQCRRIEAANGEVFRLIAQDMGILPDHNVKLFIGLEGDNDIIFLKSIAGMLRANGFDAPDLTQLEFDGKIIFVPAGGSNLATWTSRMKELNIPEFYIFDRDVPPSEASPKQGTVDEFNQRPTCEALITAKREMENYLHSQAVIYAFPRVTLQITDSMDVPYEVAKMLHQNGGNGQPWEALSPNAKRRNIRDIKAKLNSQAANAMTPALLAERDPNGEIRGWLKKISEKMLP